MADYLPNHIPAKSRWLHSIFATGILAYGAWGVWVDDLFLPGKRGPGIHLHGTPAWVMFGAMACASTLMVLVVVDHYDRRNNERGYKRAGEWLGMVMGALFVLALVLHLVQAFETRQAREAALPPGATTVIDGADFDQRQQAIAKRAQSPEVDAYDEVVALPMSKAAFACRLPGQSAYGGYTRFVVLARVSAAGDLSDVAVQPLTAFSDCMAGKLRATRLPPPPATTDADGFPLLFVFNLSFAPQG
jgi:hypothetical protein